MTAPLTLDEFRARLEAVGAPRRYVVAVSGGPDSMALARLAAEDARAGAEVLALTVDHGLREGSRAEAEAAGAWCRAAGLLWRRLDWLGDKPQTGRQEAARRARYRLLAAAAESEGYGAILTAHSADDQAETLFMRLARGSGPQGLGGMAPSVRIAAGAGAPVSLLRPFLDVSRARLRAAVAAFGQPFVDDPSNDDPAYERVRTRALLGALEEQGLLTAEALIRTAARAREAASVVAAAEKAAFRAAGGCFHAGGWASLDAARLAPSDAGMLARLIGAVAGGEHAPLEEDARDAIAGLARSRAATLGGALVMRSGESLFVLREPAALLGRAGVAPAPPVAVGPGECVIWDGRIIVRNAGPSGSTVSALGAAGAAALGPKAGLFGAPGEALASSPAGLLDPASRLAFKALAEERFFAPVLRFA